MGLISKTVNVKWHGKTRNYYESLGYVYTKNGDEFEAKVEDIPKGSHVKVNCKCDGCGKDLIWDYKAYNNYVKENGNTYCNTCGINLALNGEAYSKSFYDWCIEKARNNQVYVTEYNINHPNFQLVGEKGRQVSLNSKGSKGIKVERLYKVVP